ncbi:small acid-soluble spore protein P [Lederbergia citri]|uniref:Small acid-soluble spore protein P n=1 Tax=Lederbergia citri TaxID=2833580 RepID=A0A942YGG6_9BACI|nr:small acid-soluble spore protein P [Lederbergia citri]MBS4196128.1 small acid-soluble spore protein P [Lederbergia citri]
MGKNSSNSHEKQSNQPKPLSGSHKVKNKNHTRQNKAGGHDM